MNVNEAIDALLEQDVSSDAALKFGKILTQLRELSTEALSLMPELRDLDKVEREAVTLLKRDMSIMLKHIGIANR